jgi:hypothetical protein
MAITLTSTTSQSIDTEYSLSDMNVYNQLMDAHPISTPTLRILLANQEEKTLGPDGEFHIPIVTKDYSPSVAQQNFRFPTDDIDNITMQKWSPVYFASGAGTNAVAMARYDTPYARMNHIDLKVASVHAGITKALNYLLWYNWNTTAIVGQQIDVNSQLSAMTNPPEELYVKNVAQVSELIYSIPMLTRKTVTGYTLGNIEVTTTSNQYWHVVNTDASGATITRSTSGSNVDVVTAVDSTTCKDLEADDINDHLDKVTEGNQYTLYGACPPSLYRQLRNIITAQNTRNADSPLADLGIRSSITWDEYNVVFYIEPVMRALWPNSIFFFDPTAIQLVLESRFAPQVWQWERIPGTNMFGMAVFLSYQLVRPNAQGVSAMHGYKAS